MNLSKHGDRLMDEYEHHGVKTGEMLLWNTLAGIQGPEPAFNLAKALEEVVGAGYITADTRSGRYTLTEVGAAYLEARRNTELPVPPPSRPIGF